MDRGKPSKAEQPSGEDNAPASGQVDRRRPRRFPWCTVVVGMGCLVSQSVIFVGNKQTTENIFVLGESFSGWAGVGRNFSEVLNGFSDRIDKLASILTAVTEGLVRADAAMQDLIGELADVANASGQLGWTRNADQSVPLADTVKIGAPVQGRSQLLAQQDLQSLMQVLVSLSDRLEAHEESRHEIRRAARAQKPGRKPTNPTSQNTTNSSELQTSLQPRMDNFTKEMRNLVDLLRPVLRKLDDWGTLVANKTTDHMSEIAMALTVTQTIFDTVVMMLSPKQARTEELLYHTFNLFDVSNTGEVSLQDIHDIAEMYGIESLQASRSRIASSEGGPNLIDIYDDNGDRRLTMSEFSNFINDPSLPHTTLSDILEAYSSSLASIVGPLRGARTRAEVVSSVAKYIELVSYKNATKMGWIAQALTNASLPLNFTAGVLRELALNVENPDNLTTGNCGQPFVTMMTQQNPQVVVQALDLMANASFWASEGFAIEDQARVVLLVTRWSVSAAAEASSSRIGPEAIKEQIVKLSKHLYTRVVQSQNSEATKAQHKSKARYDQLMATELSRKLFKELLGGPPLSLSAEDPDIIRVINAGQEAQPETLEFAGWLANNASRVAFDLMALALNGAEGTGATKPRWATMVEKFNVKVWQVLQLMEIWSRPAGQHRLENFLEDWAEESLDDAVSVIHTTLPDGGEVQLAGVWSEASQIISELVRIIPYASDTLRKLRTALQIAYFPMKELFEALSYESMPFERAGNHWRMYATIYYILWMFLTVFLVAFNFWGRGYTLKNWRLIHRSEDNRDDDYDYVQPTSFSQRLGMCFRSCTRCLSRDPMDTPWCFWSTLLLADVLVLCTFYVCVGTTTLVSFSQWLHSGCQSMYMINDMNICTENFKEYAHYVKFFLPHFLQDPDICDKQKLLTCHIFQMEVHKEWTMLVVGGCICSYFSFHLILEAALIHEKARWKKVKEQLEKDT